MKFGVSLYSFHRLLTSGAAPFSTISRTLNRINVSGIEILDIHDRDALVSPDQIRDAGLICPVYSSTSNFNFAEAETRTQNIEKAKWGLERAVEYGSTIFRIFAGNIQPNVEPEQGVLWMTEALVTICTLAGETGIKVALENHGLLAGRSDQVLELIDSVNGETGLGKLWVNADIGNFILVDQDPGSAVKEVSHRAIMAHAKDFVLTVDGPFKSVTHTGYAGVEVGAGMIDVRTCVEELRDSGLTQWMMVEYEGSSDPFQAVESGIQYLASL